MLDTERGRTQRRGHPLPPAFVDLRPGRVIIDDDKWHPMPRRTLSNGKARLHLRHRLPGQAEPFGWRQLVRGQAPRSGDQFVQIETVAGCVRPRAVAATPPTALPCRLPRPPPSGPQAFARPTRHLSAGHRSRTHLRTRFSAQIRPAGHETPQVSKPPVFHSAIVPQVRSWTAMATLNNRIRYAHEWAGGAIAGAQQPSGSGSCMSTPGRAGQSTDHGNDCGLVRADHRWWREEVGLCDHGGQQQVAS